MKLSQTLPAEISTIDDIGEDRHHEGNVFHDFIFYSVVIIMHKLKIQTYLKGVLVMIQSVIIGPMTTTCQYQLCLIPHPILLLVHGIHPWKMMSQEMTGLWSNTLEMKTHAVNL